jgi:DeoR family fructose operon transcriptional repressor
MLTRLFVSAAALDPVLGSSEAALEEAEVKQVMARAASEVVLAVDGAKLNSRSTAAGLSWGDVDVLVTDLDPQAPELAQYRLLAQVR